MTNLTATFSALFLAFALLSPGLKSARNFINLQGLAGVRLTAANLAGDNDSLDKFVGTWEGKCQDNRAFVILSLKENDKQLSGTVSIGNMHGDDAGACMMVLAPPSPEHAQTVSDEVVKGNTLSFHGARRPDGTSSTFELILSDKDHAQLKLVGTPVADHPWELTRTSSK